MIGRVVAFDLGDRRIGVAVSDPTGTLASGRDTLLRDGEAWPWRAILGVIEEEEAVRVVVGNPRHMSGEASDRTAMSEAFAAELRERSGLPVDLQDERLTSVEAERQLRDSGRSKKKKRDKGEVDRAAAVLILQTWLDTQAGGGLFA